MDVTPTLKRKRGKPGPKPGDSWTQVNKSSHRSSKEFSDAVKAGYQRKLASGWKPKAPKPSTGKPFDTRINFNCTKEERSRWQAKASEIGFTMSAYLRMALMELESADESD